MSKVVNFKIKISRFLNTFKHKYALNHSYSQNAEDVIIARILAKLNIEKPSYIDIGCNEPIALNNTYLLYKNGGRGVLVDANPQLKKAISNTRPQDDFVNIGIADTSKQDMTFYTMSDSPISSFDKEMVDKMTESSKVTITNEQKIAIQGINDFLKNHYKSRVDVVSLDVEGYDTAILNAWNFKKYRPTIFCVETISHLAANKKQTKVQEIFDVFEKENYLIFADTYINTIFVDKEKWFNRNTSF